MPVNDREDEGFLARWSRRKADARDGRAAPDAQDDTRPDSSSKAPARETASTDAATDASHQTGSTAPASRQRTEEDFADVDFEALDFESDYTQFMGEDVSDDVRNKALRKLWASNPILTHMDGLDDYCEDYTDAAVAVPLGALKTAYKFGRGFLSDDEVAEWEALGAAPGVTAQPADIVVAVEPADQPEVRAFIGASDAYAASLYPPEARHGEPLAGLTHAAALVHVARRDGTAVGCGAIVLADDATAEIKRMWTDPAARRSGVGRAVLAALLATARDRGIRLVRLETGTLQPEAITLYQKAGFERRGPFGDYPDHPASVFMEFALAAPEAPTSPEAPTTNE